ncbi:MAG: GntR family histidine utilization transcriptional repressor [Alteromonadaceae bacterium]|jgi:GntR family histidine utilization transcriptional repressor
MVQAKFVIIKQHITGQIESRVWQQNAKVPSENELAQQFCVSRMTARRALQELTDEGVLTRTKGLGTFVACLKSQSSVLEIRNIADEIQARGHQYHCRQIQLQTVSAMAPINIALEVPEGAMLYYSLLIHCGNNVPLQLEERFVNPLLVSDYLAQDFSQMTPHEYLSRTAPLTKARHTIEAINPDADQCRLLEMDHSEPCLLLTRLTFSDRGVVSFARLTYPGSRYRLDSHLTFDQ